MKAPAAGVFASLLILLTVMPAEAALRLRSHVSGFASPVAIVQDPTDPTVQFVVEQVGRIRVVKNGAVLATDFLDLRGSVLFGGERGLFSIAFPPDAAASGRFYVNFTRSNGGIVVARFQRTANPLVADPGSRFDLVWPDGNAFIDHSANSNHNGGHMVFGPDGYLYIGLGDGGAGNDPPHNSQNPLKLLGKILRIDVGVADDHPKGYEIPADNPFVGGVLPGTTKPVLAEIWAFGVRNPWRFNFDDVTLGGSGALLIGDVGQGQWEEVDYEPPLTGGRNYGWRNREGNHSNVTSLPPAYLPLTNPIHEYDHGPGASASITGGYVYRGTALGPELQGRYFFADFVLKRVWSIALVVDPDTGEAHAADLREHTAELGGTGVIGNVSSFGVDGAGELYLISYFTGSVLKFAPSGPADLLVSAVSGPATGIPGKTITITNTVRNDGDQLAGPFHVDVYLSATSHTPGAGTLIGSRNVSSLAAHSISTAMTAVTVPPGAPAGLYYVSVVVDGDNVVLESNEGNNGLTAEKRVEIIRPDLMMASVTGPARGVLGKTMTVGTTVKNLGRVAAGPFAVGIYLSTVSTPGSGQRLALRSVTGLGPGASIPLTGPVTIPANLSPATYFLSAVADDGQTVSEADDAADGTNGSNNSAVALSQVQVVPFLPDLEIIAVSAPAAMGVARPLTVSFTARNTGPAPAGAFRVRFFLAPASPPPTPGDGLEVGFKALTGLAAGASMATTAVVNVPGNLSENAYYLSAVADGDGEVTEIAEGAAANGKVTATPIAVVRSDLRITRFEASVPPATARAARGGTLAVRNVTVRNAALSPGFAGAFTLKFYLSDDALWDPADVELTAAPRSLGLASGASWAIAPTLTIPASVST
ncbi:MAG TPA: CARDB domain-containing protein, partial [Candidatus Acidoferrum sp.]|nr:CARDB domain-containing protein [Candidatus Acidoferrum sp.]